LETVAQNKRDKVKVDPASITGTYQDKWFEIHKRKKGIIFCSKRSSPYGEVFFYKEGNYVVKWNNAYLHADAHLFFTFDSDGKAITLKMPYLI
jgi:hypothetical protein